MGKWSWSKERPEDPTMENNLFINGLFDHIASPEGQLAEEVRETLWPLLQTLEVDAKQRQIIWPDAKRLDLDESVQRLHAEYPDLPSEFLENRLLSWLDGEYTPERYSPKQLDELDRLTGRWLKDHARRSGRR